MEEKRLRRVMASSSTARDLEGANWQEAQATGNWRNAVSPCETEVGEGEK